MQFLGHRGACFDLSWVFCTTYFHTHMIPENRAVRRNPSSLYMYQYYYLKCNKRYPDFTADLDNSTAQKEAPNDATFIHCVFGLQLQHWQSCRNGCPDITRDLRVDAASDVCEICRYMSLSVPPIVVYLSVFCFSRYIGQVTPENVCFYYTWWHVQDQSIQKFNFILKNIYHW